MDSSRTYIEEQVVATGMFFIKEGDSIVRVAYSEKDAEKKLSEYRKLRKQQKRLERNGGDKNE